MLGSVVISPHLIFESAAYMIGFALYGTLRRQQGDVLPDTVRSSIIVATILGALAGSKLLFLLEDPFLTARSWTQLSYLLGGKTIVGGLLGGTIAVECTKARLGVTSRTGDLFTLPLIIGMAIGRIGCFAAGLDDHTYGSATSLPWGIDLGDGIPRHPVQLYEIGFLLLLAAALHQRRAALPEGGQFRAFLMLYLAWRFIIDFLKPGVSLGGLTSIQWACALALLWYARNTTDWFGARREPAHG
jgi:prolipoprotein diacylglyceryltransferase